MNKQGRSGDRMKGWIRARDRDELQSQVISHMQEGWKAIASAHELKLSLRTVQRWRMNAAKVDKT